MMIKHIILGLDGASLEWIKYYVKGRNLNAFNRLLEESAYCHVKSTIPPITPPAWATILTGVNPGKHGIFNFFDLYTGKLRGLIHSKMPLFWEILDYFGFKSAFLWVPLTYPAWRLDNTIFLSGIIVPDPSLGRNINTKINVIRAVYPRGILKKLLKSGINPLELIEKPFSIKEFADKIQMKFDIIKLLIREFDWLDLIFAVIQETDTIWHVTNDIKAGELIYSTIDKCLEDLLDFLEEKWEKYRLFIISDHGTNYMATKGVLVNNFFIEKGFLKGIEIEDITFKILRELLSFPVIRETLNFIFPHVSTHFLFKMYLRKRKSYLDMDISKSIAYMANIGASKYAGVVVRNQRRINLVKKHLMELKDNSGNILRAVYKGTEIYKGPFTRKGYSLILEFSNGYLPVEYIAPSPIIVPLNKIYAHSLYGLFIGYGYDIIKGRYLGKSFSISDFLPTILSSINLGILKYFDGEPILGIFKNASNINLRKIRIPSSYFSLVRSRRTL